MTCSKDTSTIVYLKLRENRGPGEMESEFKTEAFFQTLDPSVACDTAGRPVPSHGAVMSRLTLTVFRLTLHRRLLFPPPFDHGH